MQFVDRNAHQAVYLFRELNYYTNWCRMYACGRCMFRSKQFFSYLLYHHL